MKPPSQSYERPPIVKAGGGGDHHHLVPPKDNYLPPSPSPKPHYKPPESTYAEGMKTIMAKLSLPEQEFLEHAISGTKGYLPPQEEYKAPGGLKEHHHVVPPTSDYIETMFKYLKDLNAPTKDYLPPQEAHFQPPQESYDAPISDYLSSMHLPRKGYLPPDEKDEQKKPSKYSPPTKDYNEAMAEYFGTLRAPESAYLPPSEPKGVHMKPPASNYENPKAKYMSHMKPPASSYENPQTKYMSQMKPPATSYENPKTKYMSQLHPPDKGYLPPKELTGLLPELASYLSPISEYMASMLPPQKEYSYEERIKPPSKDYLPPQGHDGAKLKPPSREYLTPFRPSSPRRLPLFPPTRGGQGHQQHQQGARRPRPFLTSTVCPPADKDVKCEYVRHQCWSPGVPDQDCPGEGLCCFNGCVNYCLPSISPYHTNFHHIPPHQAYLVPGKENLYLQTSTGAVASGLRSSKRRNEEGDVDTLLPAGYLAPSPMYSLAALETIEISGLPDRPEVSELPPRPEKANMVPPAKDYLPPPGYHLPDDGYDLPTYEGAELSDIQKYLPPSANYQPAGVAGLRIPTEDYLPPTKITHYSPPASAYKVPKSIGVLVPPANEYLPPDEMTKYKPPSEAYQVPGTITQYHPPTADYTHPKGHLKPPTAEYLPPTTTLTPIHYSHGAVGASFRPPTDDYLVPGKENLYLQQPQPTGAPFRPPSKEYIPPSLAVSDPYHQPEKHEGVHLTPPNKKYIEPAAAAPPHPAANYQVPLVPPDQQYVVPGTKIPHHVVTDGAGKPHAVFAPPLNDYQLPLPNLPTDHGPPPKQYSPLVPPVKEYLPPEPHHDGHEEASLAPPHAAVGEHGVFHPPTKEYLPPKTIVSPEGSTFQPPASDYSVPPPVSLHSGHHVDAGGHNLDMTYKPPSKEYLPPPGYKEEQPHQDHPALPAPPHPAEIPHDDLPSLLTITPPNKEYLPPPSNAIEEIGHAIHLTEHHQHHVTAVPPVLLPKPKDKDYHITATINQDGHIEPHHGIVSHNVGPHSINIQITMPEKDKDHHHLPHIGVGPLFRTSKPPSPSPSPHHDVHVEEHVTTVHKDGYHKVMPHMLPHEHHVGYSPVHDVHEEAHVMPHMLPHDQHKGYASPGGPPPSLPQYVPPPLSTTYYKEPKYLNLPPKQYQPSYHRLPAKEYVPTNPLIYEDYPRPSYESKTPEEQNEDLINPMQTLKPPVANFKTPAELNAPIRADGYLPPEKATLRPPDKDYLPPPGRPFVEGEVEDPSIPRPPNPQDIPEEIDDGFVDDTLPTSNRGQQFPALIQKEKEYAKTPPRPAGINDGRLDIVIEDILNSQANPPSEGKEMYIPPKTKFDVPKNFIRPDDLLRAPPPPEIDDPDYDIDEFGTIDVLDANNLPEPPIPEAVPEQVLTSYSEFIVLW